LRTAQEFKDELQEEISEDATKEIEDKKAEE
jgi:hypothetical protein